MAVPFRRTGKTKKRMRRTHFKLEVTGLVTCSHCGAMIRSHIVCPECGYYDGKPVIVIEKKKEEAAKAETKKSKPKKTKEVATAPKDVKPTKATKEKSKLAIEKGKTGEK